MDKFDQRFFRKTNRIGRNTCLSNDQREIGKQDSESIAIVDDEE